MLHVLYFFALTQTVVVFILPNFAKFNGFSIYARFSIPSLFCEKVLDTGGKSLGVLY